MIFVFFQTIMSGNRQNPVLREFSMVLLCNLCGDESCARAVALQAGAISNFLSFLEVIDAVVLNPRCQTWLKPMLFLIANYFFMRYMFIFCAKTNFLVVSSSSSRPLGRDGVDRNYWYSPVHWLNICTTVTCCVLQKSPLKPDKLDYFAMVVWIVDCFAHWTALRNA